MAVTREEVCNWLDNMDFKYKLLDDFIVSGVGDGEDSLALHIDILDNGDIFRIVANILDENGIVIIKDHKYLDKILPYLLSLNYQTKFGTWEYNPDSGDIRLTIEIPLMDAKMTQKQFEKIIEMLSLNGIDMSRRIKDLIKTGEISQESALERMIRQVLLESNNNNNEEEDGI